MTSSNHILKIGQFAQLSNGIFVGGSQKDIEFHSASYPNDTIERDDEFVLSAEERKGDFLAEKRFEAELASPYFSIQYPLVISDLRERVEAIFDEADETEDPVHAIELLIRARNLVGIGDAELLSKIEEELAWNEIMVDHNFASDQEDIEGAIDALERAERHIEEFDVEDYLSIKFTVCKELGDYYLVQDRHLDAYNAYLRGFPPTGNYEEGLHMNPPCNDPEEVLDRELYMMVALTEALSDQHDELDDRVAAMGLINKTINTLHFISKSPAMQAAAKQGDTRYNSAMFALRDASFQMIDMFIAYDDVDAHDVISNTLTQMEETRAPMLTSCFLYTAARLMEFADDQFEHGIEGHFENIKLAQKLAYRYVKILRGEDPNISVESRIGTTEAEQYIEGLRMLLHASLSVDDHFTFLNYLADYEETLAKYVLVIDPDLRSIAIQDLNDFKDALALIVEEDVN